VRYAYYLMLGGAAFQVVDLLTTLAQTDRIRRLVRDMLLREQPGVVESTIDRSTNGVVGILSVVALAGTGLWIWMAFANRAGHHWARITGSVFFALGTVYYLGDLFVGGAVKILLWLVGLAVVILLWNRRSGEFFRSVSYGQEYQPPGAASGYPPTGPGPAPGQTAPPPGPSGPYGAPGPPEPPSQPPQGPPSGPPPSDGPESMPPPR
jgi:hypothetical protein